MFSDTYTEFTVLLLTAAVIGARKSSLDELGAMYNRVRTQPLESAELEQTVVEFERFRSTLGASEADQRLSKVIGNYIEAMKIRIDLREAKKSSAAEALDTGQ